MKPYLLVATVGGVASLASGSTFSPARPPAIPLAGTLILSARYASDKPKVKSPYMSTWLEVVSDGGSGGNLAGYWPHVTLA